jgi:hypothetical protein
MRLPRLAAPIAIGPQKKAAGVYCMSNIIIKRPLPLAKASRSKQFYGVSRPAWCKEALKILLHPHCDQGRQRERYCPIAPLFNNAIPELLSHGLKS